MRAPFLRVETAPANVPEVPRKFKPEQDDQYDRDRNDGAGSDDCDLTD
jgi:hypothetical protein